jgi:flagellar hook-length control protein FliK
VQGAAPAALISGNAKTAKTSAKRGAKTHAKTAFQAILGAKASAVRDAHELKASLLKALARNAASGNAHTDGLAASFPMKNGVGAQGKQLVQEKPLIQGKQLVPEGTSGPQHHVSATIPHPQDEKKRTAKSLHHSDGLTLTAPTHAAESTAGVKASAKLELSKTPAVEQQSSTVSHKVPQVHVHLVDARKKHTDMPADDQQSRFKAPQAAASQTDVNPAVITRSSVPAPENTARETARQGQPAQAPFAGTLERLRDMAGSELTRAAGIILRDGGGEIKLTLKPESLGSVRIRLNLVDNVIEGRIIVDNSAVRHIFEGSLDSLTRAFTAEGFQTTSLQVSVGGQGTDNGRQDRESLPRIQRIEALQADWNVPEAENLSMGDLLVNLFV